MPEEELVRCWDNGRSGSGTIAQLRGRRALGKRAIRMPVAPCADAAEREVTADLSWKAPWRHGGSLAHLLVVGRNPPGFWKPTAVNAVNLGKRAGRSRLQSGVGCP